MRAQCDVAVTMRRAHVVNASQSPTLAVRVSLPSTGNNTEEFVAVFGARRTQDPAGAKAGKGFLTLVPLCFALTLLSGLVLIHHTS